MKENQVLEWKNCFKFCDVLVKIRKIDLNKVNEELTMKYLWRLFSTQRLPRGGAEREVPAG